MIKLFICQEESYQVADGCMREGLSKRYIPVDDGVDRAILTPVEIFTVLLKHMNPSSAHAAVEEIFDKQDS